MSKIFNPQTQALLQNLLLIGGSLAVSSGKISPTDVQTLVGAASVLAGFFWNHYSALTPK